jgi:hypothetical protein
LRRLIQEGIEMLPRRAWARTAPPPILLLALACCTLPQPASVTDPRAVYVWPVAACPSEPPAARPAVLPAIIGALATPLLTDVVSGFVGVPVSAIQQAANADKNGFTANGQNPRFFFPEVSATTTGGATTYRFTPPGCYVVAYTRYVAKAGDDSASSWCDDTRFSTALPIACSASGKARLAKVLPAIGFPSGFAPAVPDFYAEVKLQASEYRTKTLLVSYPRVIAMRYPHALLDASSQKPRTLTMTLTLSSGASTSATDLLKTASVAVVVPDVVPAAAVPQETLVAQQSSWVSMPASVTIGAGDPAPNGGPYYPVNISASLKEIGDPNAFLQAFATAVAASAPDYTKAIANAIWPVAVAAAQQQAASNAAAVLAAQAQATTDESKYLAACTPPPKTAAAKKAAEGLYQTVLADRQKANAAAALTPGAQAPFASLTQGLTPCF